MIMATNGVPTGIRFAPGDDEILSCFLNNLITTGHPSSLYIHNLDIFGPHPPWEIATEVREEQRNDFYVFTKLKKLSPRRYQRTSKNGQGTWKGQSVETRLEAKTWDNSVLVAQKKSFSFLYGKNKVTSHWNLYEYNLLEIDGIPILDDADGCRWVICRVIYNKNFRKKTSIDISLVSRPSAAAVEAPPPLLPFVDYSDTAFHQELEAMLEADDEVTPPSST